MALAGTGKTLGKTIADIITAADAPPEAKTQIIQVWGEIGEAIIAHIITHAEVAPGIAVATTGTPAAQTGATTASGSIV
jgi:hypothetical protein